MRPRPRPRRRRWRRRPAVAACTARTTNSPTRTGSRRTSATPASMREISSRSWTSRWKRRISAVSRSSAARDRSGSSLRRELEHLRGAASVVSGDRSSWLTADANRASRSMRCTRCSVIWLNDGRQRVEVGIAGRLEAHVVAPTRDGGGRARRRAHRPQHAAGSPTGRWPRPRAWSRPPPRSASCAARSRSALDLAAAGTISKYAALDGRERHARPPAAARRRGRSAAGRPRRRARPGARSGAARRARTPSDAANQLPVGRSSNG